MSKQTDQEDELNVWTPLERTDLETVLTAQEYTTVHLHLLFWLIWFPLLSNEECMRVLSSEEATQSLAETKEGLLGLVHQMVDLGLIDTVILREPGVGRHHRYYATDLGLYLYLSVVHPTPSLTVAQLAKAYPVVRDDLLARLARPQVHMALTSLATRLVAEGDALGYHLVSYQQPWQHLYTTPGRRQRLSSDAALLIQRPAGTPHAFFVYADPGSHAPTDREVRKRLLRLLDLREQSVFSRHSWPGLLIITVQERLAIWATLLFESCQMRLTRPLAGGITTIQGLREGVYGPIWWDLTQFSYGKDPDRAFCVPLYELLGDPASPELAEQFSQRMRFHQLLIDAAAAPPPRTRKHLVRYVGDALHYEAAHLTADRLEQLFAAPKQDHKSVGGAGLLSLTLTVLQKDILSWMARHPFLDGSTLLALLRPERDEQSIVSMQQQITGLLKLRLIETKAWLAGTRAWEDRRYLLTSVALRFIAIREGEPFSAYCAVPTSKKKDPEIWRQWGTAALYAQMDHTVRVYAFMGQLLRACHRRAEKIIDWKSAHEATRWFEDSLTHASEMVRPDAELVCASSGDEAPLHLWLVYDRETPDEDAYRQRFKTAVDYQLATGCQLPLIVAVTSSSDAVLKMQRVLAEFGGSLQVAIVLEHDLLTHGVFAALQHRP